MVKDQTGGEQNDGYSCGYFLHYWEGEVRRSAGEGWVVGRVLPDKIKKIKDRLIHVSKEVEEFKKKILPKKVEESDEVDPLKQFPASGPRSPAAEHIQKYLRDEAKRSLDQALVPFYGCSKCRYGRKGCISYQCNPNKFEAHLLAHPEMYFNRKVRATAWKAMSGPEFLGIS